MIDFESKRLRVIDANYNRANEGLRVAEEIARLVLDDFKIALELKELRHNLNDIFRQYFDFLSVIKARDIEEDVLAKNNKDLRVKLDFLALARSNFNRIKEALRVLEEFSLGNGLLFQKLRYRIYALEKKLVFTLHHKSNIQKLTFDKTD